MNWLSLKISIVEYYSFPGNETKHDSTDANITLEDVPNETSENEKAEDSSEQIRSSDMEEKVLGNLFFFCLK